MAWEYGVGILGWLQFSLAWNLHDAAGLLAVYNLAKAVVERKQLLPPRIPKNQETQGDKVTGAPIDHWRSTSVGGQQEFKRMQNFHSSNHQSSIILSSWRNTWGADKYSVPGRNMQAFLGRSSNGDNERLAQQQQPGAEAASSKHLAKRL